MHPYALSVHVQAPQPTTASSVRHMLPYLDDGQQLELLTYTPTIPQIGMPDQRPSYLDNGQQLAQLIHARTEGRHELVGHQAPLHAQHRLVESVRGRLRVSNGGVQTERVGSMPCISM